MADDQTNEQRTALAAPYTAFSSVKTALRQMKEHGIPNRVDRSVLTNFSGAVVSQVITAFKFLALIDNDGRPSDYLMALVNAVDDEQEWPRELKKVLEYAYAPLFEHNLEAASPSQFNEGFKRSYPGADDVVRKSMTFFLNAAREAAIPISKYILKNKKPRSAPAKKRAPKQQRAASDTPTPTPPTPPQQHVQHPTVAKPMEYQLLDLLGAGMTDDERAAVWTLISYVKKQPKGTA